MSEFWENLEYANTFVKIWEFVTYRKQIIKTYAK